MKLSVDHSFHIGEQHLRQGKPAQDYALSGVIDDVAAYAIVSDGCSSGGQTDIGARLLSLATKRALKENSDEAAFAIARDSYAEVFRSTLGLEHRDMLATNLFARVQNDEVFVHVTGDGVVALLYEHDLVLHQYTWEQNTPYYPAYRIGGFDESFIDLHKGTAKPLRLNSTYRSNETAVCEFTIGEGVRGIESVYEDISGYHSKNPLLAIGLFSDGVEQVDQFATAEVVQALMSFKSTSGQFATRRMNRFLQEARKRGRGPLDDIAMAVIHLGQQDT